MSDKEIICQWIGCNKPATVRIVRASACVCDEHYAANVLQFGCVFETEKVNKQALEGRDELIG